MKKKYTSPRLTTKKFSIDFLIRNNRFYDVDNNLLNIDGILLAGSGGGGCLLPDTRVMISEEKNVPISQLKKGDLVYSYSFKKKLLVENRIEKVLVHDIGPQDYYIINDKLRITPNHPIFANDNEWKRVGKLTLTDKLLDPQGKPVVINKIERKETESKVYNLVLKNPEHNFFTNNILVHNGLVVHESGYK